MPLAAPELQTLVVTEVGDVDGFIAGQIATLWALYDTQPDLYLRYLLTKRKALDLLMGKVREQVNRTGLNGVAAELSDKLGNLQVMWENVDGEIATLTKTTEQATQESTQRTRRPLSGQLTATLGGLPWRSSRR